MPGREVVGRGSPGGVVEARGALASLAAARARSGSSCRWSGVHHDRHGHIFLSPRAGAKLSATLSRLAPLQVLRRVKRVRSCAMRAERRQCHHRPLLPQRVVHPPLSTARADVLCSPAAIADPRVFTRRLCFTQSWFSGQRSAPRGARNMDRLKSVLAAKKKETTEKFGEKKFLKRAELEAQKAKRPREQGGAQENVEEESSKKSRAENADAPSPSGRSEDQETKTCVEDVVRRLRKIGQPKTLFGETDEDRLRRLLKCEAEMVVDELDDHGVTGKNVLKVIEEEEEAMRKQMAMQKAGQEGDEESMPPPEPVDPVKAAFERAARKLRDQKSDELPPDDKVLYWLDRWCQEWKEDLDARDVAAKETSRGKHATNLYKTSMIYFRPLREELEQRTLKQDVLIGLIIMVDAMRDRNYRDAMDAYIKICIGNAAWPIGVTQVGIQRMASRDKIKEVNAGKTSSAHIMSDEATRKWLQAWKRLMSVVQRVHPTDPSRAVDFGAREDAGWGAKGRGSVKAAFQEAKLTEAEELERAKDKVKVLQNEKGEVLIPEKLSFTLKKGQEWLKNRDIGPQPQ